MAYSVARIVYGFTPMVGGSITHVIELSNQMDKVLSNQVIIAPDWPGGTTSDKKSGLKVVRIPILLNGLVNLLTNDILAQIIYAKDVVDKIIELNAQGIHFDILHAHGPLIGSFIKYFTKKKLNIPVIVMNHGGYGTNDSPNLLTSGRFSKSLIRIVMKQLPADNYLALDDGTGVQKMRRDIIECHRGCTIVNHGIDTELFAPGSDSKALSNGSRLRILFPHRIYQFKRPDIALDILYDLVFRYKIVDVEMIFLSDSKEEMMLSDMARAKDIADFVSFEPKKQPVEMVGMYNSCDVIIGTSIISNINRATLEAMSCGRAVVIFDSGDLKGLVDNTNGFVVKSGDLNGFTDAIYELYLNPDLRARIGAEARKTIIQNRSWKNRIKVELETYESVLSNFKSNSMA